jgi:hypothetical protein
LVAKATDSQAPVKQDKNRDNKGRFQKGTTGNPNGRPPAAFSITELLRAKVSERPRIVDRLIELADSEDENVALKAILGIANRLDGMPKQSIDAEHKGTIDVQLSWSDGSQA